jgi:HNH endonuclease
MAVSKRTRFEIFKRDGFRCVYCGATPNTTVLHVDHVEPKAKGGTDDPSNLVTSCQPCNGGKSDVRLQDKRLHSGMSTEDAREHAEQIMGYLEAQRAILAARDTMIDALRQRWEEAIGWTLPASERASLGMFLEHFTFADLASAVDIAASKFCAPVGSASRARSAFRYFCGIVHTWRRDGAVTLGSRGKR